MTVVFDKENARSFFKSLDDAELGVDIMNLLKRQINLHFNFELSDIEEELEIQILEFIEVGGRVSKGLTIKFEIMQIDTPMCVKDVPNKNNVYLMENLTTKLKDADIVMVGGVGEEIQLLEKLFLNTDDASVHENPSIGPDNFGCWKKMEDFNRPFTSMVVIDRYMFKGPLVGGNLGLFQYNLGKLLGVLFKDKKYVVDLTFIYQINPNVQRTNPTFDEGPDFSALKKEIKKAVKMFNKHCPTPKINFIAVPKGRIKDEHDRHILTNYLKIKSGDTFVFYDSNGDKIALSNELDVYSMARDQYRKTRYELVQKMNRVVNQALNQFGNYCEVNTTNQRQNIILF